MITVAELIEELSKRQQDAVVIISRDTEGNGYSPCDGYCNGKYVANSGYSGEFAADVNIAEYNEWGDYDEYIRYGVDAVVLWPTN